MIHSTSVFINDDESELHHDYEVWLEELSPHAPADQLKMLLGVQGHHALMDGVQVGKFYAEVQGYLQQPGALLGEA